MALVLSDNIISPLGFTSMDNYLAVKSGKSGIRVYPPGSHGVPGGFTASLIEDSMMKMLRAEGNGLLPDENLADSHFVQLAYSSAHKALKASGIDTDKIHTVFILSTTKGAIEEYQTSECGKWNLPDLAQKIAQTLGIHTKAIVVCNACTSGLSALILANRLLDAGEYEAAVVSGIDCPGKFIISGFQSLNAVSTNPCRPFDMERQGLNLGEAAATLVLVSEAHRAMYKNNGKSYWNLRNGYIKNDAFHVTSPAKDGAGLFHALTETLQGVDIHDLSFINAHGTATLFNDQMESVAIENAGLSLVPANALKGYFGHTLGAAGILETVISIYAANDATILGTLGFKELGVSGKVNLSNENKTSDKRSFIKMMSGFGGCNASLLAQQCKGDAEDKTRQRALVANRQWRKTHRVRITPRQAFVDGLLVERCREKDFVAQLYKSRVGSYPKFFKMDRLSRLGFVASELLLDALEEERFVPRCDRAVVLCNRTSSICADKKYLQSIEDGENYFPSPSVFVYTLPNIVTGEIAIRNGYRGETSFYLLSDKDEELVDKLTNTAFADRQTDSVLGGWLDYEGEELYEADLFLAEVKS